jgi:enamine deaminase RidA (YjgF/YER057c/UK114 family)
MTSINPEGWPRPSGYSNAVIAQGRTVFLAGQVGWNERGVFVSDLFVDQAKAAIANVVTVLRAAGGSPEHLVRLTWYVTDKSLYRLALPELGAAYREILGAHYPAMTLVVVAALLEDRALVEIEATAVLP